MRTCLKISKTRYCCCLKLFSSSIFLKDPQTYFSLIYHLIKLGLATDEDKVTAEESSAAVPDGTPCLEGDKEASCMEEVNEELLFGSFMPCL